jgi:hypothetical protein
MALHNGVLTADNLMKTISGPATLLDQCSLCDQETERVDHISRTVKEFR